MIDWFQNCWWLIFSWLTIVLALHKSTVHLLGAQYICEQLNMSQTISQIKPYYTNKLLSWMWFQTFEGWSIQLKKTKQNNTNNEKKQKNKNECNRNYLNGKIQVLSEMCFGIFGNLCEWHFRDSQICCKRENREMWAMAKREQGREGFSCCKMEERRTKPMLCYLLKSRLPYFLPLPSLPLPLPFSCLALWPLGPIAVP